MYKKCKILLSIAMLMAAISGYAKPDVVGSFIASNFKPNEVVVASENEKKTNFFQKIIEHFMHPNLKSLKNLSKNAIIKISEQDKARSILSFFESKQTDLLEDIEIINLELLSGAGQTNKSLFSVLLSLMNVKTFSGKIMTAKTLITPVPDVSELEKRKELTNSLITQKRTFVELSYYLEKLSSHENSLLEFFYSTSLLSDGDQKFIYSESFPLKFLINNSSICYNVAELLKLSFLSMPLAITAGTIGSASFFKEEMTKFLNVIKNPPKEYKYLVYGYAIFISSSFILGDIMSMSAIHTEISFFSKRAKEIQKHLIDVAEYVYQCERIAELIEKTPELLNTSFGTGFIEFKNNPALKRLKSLLGRATFQGSNSAFCNWGNVFITYKEMEKQKEHFIPLIKAVGELDMYCGLAQLMQTHGNSKNQVQFCFAEYIQNDTPVIRATNFWNPFVLTHKSMQDIVTNKLVFDTADEQSGIFTGPNTCGKTTVIIAIMLNAILAQTFGIAAAKEFIITPFGKFNATLTVTTDGAIGDSRFKSEVREAQKILKRIEDAKASNLFTLTIQDEIFTGTNQRDGEVAAYNFLQKLGGLKNNITLLATHYVDKLTTLGAPFVNLKINAEVQGIDEVIRYYTVSHGVSNLNIAHIIAKQAGLGSAA